MQTSNYKVLLREEPEGGYTVFVPSLEGCISYGEDITIAKANAKEAIELYIESLKQDNLPVPTDDNLLEMNLEVVNG
ncbi:MAG: type II toxin-antitoxin system HicB family antitoxin [Cyclobacteriaceae bacterium]